MFRFLSDDGISVERPLARPVGVVECVRQQLENAPTTRHRHRHRTYAIDN